MRGHVIAVANMKGGVGKTATAVALSQALAAESRRYRVLTVDTDAQASASFCLAGDRYYTDLVGQGLTLDAFLQEAVLEKQDAPLSGYVRRGISAVSHAGTQLDISLIASSPRLRTVERTLIHAFMRSGFDMVHIEREMCTLLAGELGRLRARYDFILLDCAPGISLLTEAAIRVADLVVVPTIPDYLSVLGFNAFRRTLWTEAVRSGSSLPRPSRLPHVLITRRRANVRSHDLTAELLFTWANARPPEFRIFSTVIPETAQVAAALERTATGYPTFLDLWDHLVPKLQSLAREVTAALRTRQRLSREGSPHVL